MPAIKYRLYRRANGIYYQEDTQTKAQLSLRTKDKHTAQEKLRAANESVAQPRLNLDLARIYLQAHDSDSTERTWKMVMTGFSERGRDSSRRRCRQAFSGQDFDSLRSTKIIETKAEDLLRVLHTGKPSVNHYLRRLVHHAENLWWLHWMIMAPDAWPKPKKSSKRGVTPEEHEQIIAAEKNPERRAYYQMLWATGGSQLDVALFRCEDIQDDVLVYQRRKLNETATPCSMTVGSAMRVLLTDLPTSGWLFPTLAKRELSKEKGDSNQRAAEFSRRCRLLKIKGISLHSYRYAWAGRAAQIGYPQRYAQAALGHKSAAVHIEYAKHARVTVPALEDYSNSKLSPSTLVSHSTGNAPTQRMTSETFHSRMLRKTQRREILA